MKSPREILLERHRAAQAKLDRIRENVISEMGAPAEARRSDARGQTADGAWASLQKSVLSMRWHLAGLSAAWLVVALLSIEQTPNPAKAPSNTAEQKIPSPQQLWTALRENRRQLLEVMELPTAAAAPALPHGRDAERPQRRGEGPSATAMV